jgi:hypothetical protein
MKSCATGWLSSLRVAHSHGGVEAESSNEIILQQGCVKLPSGPRKRGRRRLLSLFRIRQHFI